jgi:CheY-like chemotaxis protein
MLRIQLIHWNHSEAEQRARRLEAAGYEVAFDVSNFIELQRALRREPPAAVVIDLGRLPSQGRDFAVGLRAHASTRGVPIVFVGGDPAKVAPIRQRLPDAVYTTWEQVEADLARAIANPPQNPVAMRSQMDGYAGKPLAAKLGIKAGMKVALMGEPEGFRTALGELPEGVELCAEPCWDSSVVVWFVRSRRVLEEGIDHIAAHMAKNSLWVAWPKKRSLLATDVSEPLVRSVGLAAGLVDFKICAIDSTWSGLCFRRRKKT